jgi:hypothetical protein
MIPGSQPMHVINDDREQTSEAMARPEVRCAAVAGLTDASGGVSSGTDVALVPAVSFGTVMVALQLGQAICVPAWVVSHKMFWPQAGHENLNSLIGFLFVECQSLWY